MGEVGEVANNVMGGPQSVGNVPQGGDTGGTIIWLVYLGPIGGDGEYSGGYAHRQTTGKRVRRKEDGRWVTPKAELVREAA